MTVGLSDALVAAVVKNGRASLNELRTIYSLEDLYRLWEIDYINQYNSWYESEQRREREELNRLYRKMTNL